MSAPRLQLNKITRKISGEVNITGSKSESNRLLILQQFLPGMKIENLSNSKDSQVLQEALSKSAGTVDIGHAGTAMRFLTAYYASLDGADLVLTGSDRMQERPIGILVDALNSLGASIRYAGSQGYPPLMIEGKKIQGGHVTIQGDISSQYITAMLLIAPSLERGLQIEFSTALTSIPYVEMTLELLKEVGVQAELTGKAIRVAPGFGKHPEIISVESDWSSASYYYSLAALSQGSSIALSTFRPESRQGDSELVSIYRQLGVHTEFDKDGLVISHSGEQIPNHLELDLRNTPDIAQTIAVTCLGLGISCFLKGLHTLRIKETDRLYALKKEIGKLGGELEITEDSLALKSCTGLNQNARISTYDDHRMAMAFAPLATRIPLVIEDPEVVVKSYPEFWTHFNAVAYGTI
jgi:3-phosphoshikimate 1-carboxyvinyltransferase